MSSKKEKKTVRNTGNTNGAIEKEPENPQNMKIKLAQRQKDILRTKLDNVEANKDDLLALHFAAKVSDVEVCRHLVEQEGAHINEKCSISGATPLHYAAMNETHADALIDFFLQKGCDFENRDSHNARPIDYALQDEVKMMEAKEKTRLKRNESAKKARKCSVCKKEMRSDSISRVCEHYFDCLGLYQKHLDSCGQP
ncbi:uncharacterized protein LOC135943819 [Cloeon dipterum]|uniref:uncharacterized protein LOC135943819 n=1 Tax=Cloeon dipterum TaxID=197152 RepID=UPI00321F8A97